MFLYDTHIHTLEASACGKNTAREMVRSFKEQGYAGFAITNHFYHGNSSSDRTGTWKEFVQPYIDAYYEACDEAVKYDFDVIFGIEEGVGDSKEMLCYNLDFDFLLNCEELRNADRKTFVDLVHSAGGIVVQAHPYRIRAYMKRYVDPYFDDCDGIEVWNCGNFAEENEKAFAAAEGKNFILTAGTDSHTVNSGRHAGVLLPKRVATAADFVEVLKSGNYKLVTE